MRVLLTMMGSCQETSRQTRNADLKLCHRLRRWPNFKPTLYQHLVFTVVFVGNPWLLTSTVILSILYQLIT